MLFRRKNPSIFSGLASFFWPQKGFIRGWIYLMMRILRIRSSDYSLAAGIASGVAVSFTPLIGFHFILAGVLAWLVRGNLVMAMIGTVIGNPWTFPLIWVLIHSVGVSMLGAPSSETDVSVLSYELLMDSPGSVLVSMLLGGVVVGSISGLIVFALGYSYAGKIRAKLNEIKMKRLRRKAERKKELMSATKESDHNV